MKYLLPVAVVLALLPAAAFAQVGVGTTTPDAKAALDIRATDKGLLVPRLTASQRTGIASPPQGLMVYQTDGTADGGAQTGFWYYAGSPAQWVFLDPTPSGGGDNLGNHTATQNLNLADKLLVGTSGRAGGGPGTEGLRVDGAGRVGIGLAAAPTEQLEVAGDVKIINPARGGGSGLVFPDGTRQTTAATGGGGLTLPYAGSASGSGNAFAVSNTGAGSGIYGTTSQTLGALSNVAGVVGEANGSQAVGVLGLTTTGYAVRGIAAGSSGVGVFGQGSGNHGVQGVSTSSSGVYGTVTNATLSSVAGVQGVGAGSGTGVLGSSTSGSGVVGTTAGSASGVAGLEGTSTNSSGTGVLGTTASGYGVRGEASGSSGYGVTGVASGSNGIGVFGNATGAATGVTGQAGGTGRAGYFSQSNPAYTGAAVEIISSGQSAALVITHPSITTFPSSINGLIVNDASSTAQASIASGSIELNPLDGSARGVSFSADGGGRISVRNTDALGLVCNASGIASPFNYAALNAQATGGALAGRFLGNVSISGSLSKAAGSFKIDHPLNPENQYLYHSFVESPDMLNIYNGNVTLDARGEATVELPDYFEALNRDFRYQLTSLGAFMPVFVKEKVAQRRFRIAGGTPGGEVSWQVTGVRHDKWADQNRIPNATPKEPENRGKYLHPEAFGLPASRGIGHRLQEQAQGQRGPFQRGATTVKK